MEEPSSPVFVGAGKNKTLAWVFRRGHAGGRWASARRSHRRPAGGSATGVRLRDSPALTSSATLSGFRSARPRTLSQHLVSGKHLFFPILPRFSVSVQHEEPR